MPIPETPIHDSQTIQHGWEWYEIGFLVRWTPPSSTTIICFDLPQHVQSSVQSALASRINSSGFSDPFVLFAALLYELVSMYDNSVWSIRNHICEWEAVGCRNRTMACRGLSADEPSQTRQQEPDYPLLHEIGRHAIHVSETLAVAVQTVKGLQRQYEDFMALRSQSSSAWHRNQVPFHFPLRVLEGLLLRAKSNKARVQNETSLVRSKLALFLSAARRI